MRAAIYNKVSNPRKYTRNRIYRKLCTVYGDNNVIRKPEVYRKVKLYSERSVSTHVKTRPGRPSNGRKYLQKKMEMGLTKNFKITGDFNFDTLIRLKHAIQVKCLGKLSKSTMLLHNNARHYIASFVCPFSAELIQVGSVSLPS